MEAVTACVFVPCFALGASSERLRICGHCRRGGWQDVNPSLCELVTSPVTEADRSFKKCNFRIDIPPAKSEGRHVHSAQGELGAVTQKEETALTLPFCAGLLTKELCK